ncbi:MAG: RNA 2',3'-cyclic phosphodiesterase [Candidatus Hydrogenedens sp.]|nr:RNA 2',3'-cyclic phosphodiesterase [Candidatus Hydrogenedens sp.]
MSEESYRAFVAIELPAEVRDIVWSSTKPVLGSLKSLVKWVPPENMHLTLRFLGGITLSMSEKLRSNLKKVSIQFAPITFRLGTSGVFPSWREPRVLWVGLDVVKGDLSLLQRRVEQEAQIIGLPLEKQRFHPHITVGRVRTPSPFISNTWKNVKIQSTPEFVVNQITLFKSILNPNGAIYEVVDTFQFNQGE